MTFIALIPTFDPASPEMQLAAAFDQLAQSLQIDPTIALLAYSDFAPIHPELRIFLDMLEMTDSDIDYLIIQIDEIHYFADIAQYARI